MDAPTESVAGTQGLMDVGGDVTDEGEQLEDNSYLLLHARWDCAQGIPYVFMFGFVRRGIFMLFHCTLADMQ